MIALPAVFGIAAFALNKRRIPRLVIVIVSSAVNLLFAFGLYFSKEFYLKIPFASEDMAIALRVYGLSALFLLIAAAGFLLVS
jgi:hypothetical protein